MIRLLALMGVALSAFAAREGVGSAVCGTCHREILLRYQRTPMGASAGRVGALATGERFDRAEFRHVASGFRYRVERNGSRYSLDYQRGDGARAEKRLAYFIGSGAVARSYLLEASGFLFEAPVAYYSAGNRWELAPGYERYTYPYLTRPILPACLNCHASFLRPVAGTQNRYEDPPFEEGGVACERCHGAGDQHVQKMRKGGAGGDPLILNPSKLEPDRRDSICAQCHLTGEVRVMRRGRDWTSYRPGDRLSDSIAVFVRSTSRPGITVTSHVEKLAQSACKRAAGDRLWCGSCHEPHSRRASEGVRDRCLTCHTAGACRETESKRRAAGDRCAVCHMPKNPVTDAQHVVYTDHSIPRRPLATQPAEADFDLIPFGPAKATERDMALAYGILATRDKSPHVQQRAQRLLEQAAEAAPDDVEVLLYLAERYRNASQYDRAIPLFERAVRLDPTQVTGPVGLGGIRAERGEYREAVRLWTDALAKNAGLQLVRVSMAMALLQLGEKDAARSVLREAAELNPGFRPAAELLEKLKP